jgi:hypothetical protein
MTASGTSSTGTRVPNSTLNMLSSKLLGILVSLAGIFFSLLFPGLCISTQEVSSLQDEV